MYVLPADVSKAFDPAVDAPFEINCILDAKASVAYHQYSILNSTFKLLPAGYKYIL